MNVAWVRCGHLLRLVLLGNSRYGFWMRSLSYLLILAAFIGARVTAEDSRPNILWIYLEDVSGWFSCYGDTVIETPHLDALAESGIRFNRFYTPAGVCSATRSAILVGAMQTSFGIHNHRSGRATFRGQSMGPNFDDIRLPEGVRTLPEIFRSAGYFTFNDSGKDDYNFDHDLDVMYSVRKPGTRWKLNSDGKPFFGQIQLRGGKLGRRAKAVVDRQSVPVPPYYPDTELVREEIAHHYDCLLHTDQQVGQIIAELKADGLYSNTVIFLFSDHGYKMHRHKQFLYEGGIRMPMIVAGKGIHAGRVRSDLVSGIDIAPASLAAAGLMVPDYMEGDDFLSPDYQARSYLVAARDRCDYTIERIRAIVTPRFKYLRNYLTDRPYMQPNYKDNWPVSKELRALMADGKMNETQLIFFGAERPAEELYDLQNDPHEIRNLANNPRFQSALKQHRELLREWIEETGDKGQVTESDAGLLSALKRWRDKCVNPEYDRVRHLLEEK